MGAREVYREIILDNIEYEYLIQDDHIDREQLDEIAELIVDTVCSARKTIRIAGDDYPAEVVKSRFMKLDSSHVRYVMDCMRDNTTYVRNIKKYLLAALYNAPSTISNYYFENSDFIYLLNQASGDRKILCERLNISTQQAAHISNAGPGEGLIFFGNVILPFADRFPQDNELYSIMTTRPGETAAEEE